MRWLLAAIVVAFASCATTEPTKPLVDGRREKISTTDLQELDNAGCNYIATYPGPKGAIYRFEVVDRDRVKIYYGPHVGAGPIGDVQWLEAKRIHDNWQIADAIYPAEPSVEGL
jgi:hypothetical protein